MSEDKFTVPARKPASPKKPAGRPAAKAPAQKKASGAGQKAKGGQNDRLESARVRKAPSGRLAHKSLPDVADMSTMTRNERIEAVLGTKKTKPAAAQKTGTKSGAKTASNRYEGMRRQIEKTEAGRKGTAVAQGPSKETGGSATAIRLALCLLAVTLILIVIVIRNRAASVPAEPAAASAMPEETVTVEIRPGMGAGEAAAAFSSVLDSSALLDYLVTNGLDTSIRSGSYTLQVPADVPSVAGMITAQPESSVTVYAGYTVQDIDRLLANRGLADSGDFISACESVAGDYGLSFIEGWLLAGSYQWSDERSLALDMLEASLSLLKDQAGAVQASGLSLDQIMTIASMVNRETQDAEQMPVIAAVILNRLEAGMPLGIDATTRYELDRWTGTVSQAEYDRITPYNTRRRRGLPPSGIGAPSAEAVRAVLYPAATDALYYLHDEEGRLHTSYTYQEHLAAYESVH